MKCMTEPEGEEEEEKFATAILDKEFLGDMLTAEFLVKGHIAGNVQLEVKEMETDGDHLELILEIHEGYVN